MRAIYVTSWKNKGYVYLVPTIPNLQIPIDTDLIDIADDCHIRHAAFRAWAWKIKKRDTVRNNCKRKDF